MSKDDYYSEKLFCAAGKEVKEKISKLAKMQARPLYEAVDDALRNYLTSQKIELKTVPKRIEVAKSIAV